MGGGDTEEGWEYVRKFCDQLDGKILGGSSAVYKGVADGEYTVGLTFEQGSAQYVGAGAPVKTVYMEEGVIFRGDRDNGQVTEFFNCVVYLNGYTHTCFVPSVYFAKNLCRKRW